VQARTGQRMRLGERCQPGRYALRPEAPDGGAVFIPRLGLQLAQHLPLDRWIAIGRQLSEVATSSAWCLGDWLVYGEAAYSGRYREAIEHTSLDYQTLRNYAWVAKRFPLSRRRDTLSFGHHTEVAALADAEQDFWLRKADELAWSCKQLRAEVRASLRERADGEEDDAVAADASRREQLRLHLRLSADLMEVCRSAADKAGLSIDAWAALALERAARSGSVENIASLES
jgi:hypothetical protein